MTAKVAFHHIGYGTAALFLEHMEMKMNVFLLLRIIVSVEKFQFFQLRAVLHKLVLVLAAFFAQNQTQHQVQALRPP